MKKTVLLLLTTLVLLCAATAVFAHPPKAISVGWDAGNQILNVSAEHNVNDPAKHYVLSMTIFEGNKQLLQKQYTSQSSPEKFEDSVALKGIASGTVLRIQLVCNIMGSQETEFRIP